MLEHFVIITGLFVGIPQYCNLEPAGVLNKHKLYRKNGITQIFKFKIKWVNKILN